MNKIIFVFLALLLVTCKTNQTINGKREGIWITKFALDSMNNKFVYKSKEIYKNGIPIRTWKNYLDGKLIKKENHLKDCTAIVTEYYPNGKTLKKGKTKTKIGKKDIHWYYFGPWEFYDESGKLTHISEYENGIAIKTDTIK